MTTSAGVRHFQCGRVSRRYKFECMRPNAYVRKLRLDLRHVTRDAFVANAAGRVMSVGLDRFRMRTVRRSRAVAFETKNVRQLQQIRVVLRTMNIVATETGDAAGVHDALHEVVALHPVLVRRAIGKVRE